MKFIVPGKAIGKGRPRFTRIGGYVRTYTPKTTADYEKKIREAYLLNRFKKIETGAIKIKIVAYYKPPKSVSKRKYESLILNRWYDKKPDLDNIAKIVCDALNKVAYTDDNQISFIMMSKEYAEEDYLEVEIERL